MSKKNDLRNVIIFLEKLHLVNRLLVEYTITKENKLNILKRFDSVSSLKEINKLYRTIKVELA